MRIRRRLPLAFILTTLVFAGVVALAVAFILRGVFLDRLQDDMARQAHQYAVVLATAGDRYAATVDPQELTQSVGAAGEVRFTLVAADGRVLADSQADPTRLDNHADRREIVVALTGGEGRARRDSATLGQEEVYVAVPLPAGDLPWSDGALRAALPAARIDAMLSASWRIPLIVWAILLLPTLAVAYLLSRSITRPLARLGDMTARVAQGDFSARTAVHRRDELGELGEALDAMAEQLESRAEELAQEVERSGGVLAAMTEGVVLIDAAGRLLRSNPAAARILGADLQGKEGMPLVHVARSFPAAALAQKGRERGKPLTEAMELAGGRVLAVEVVPLGGPKTEENQTLFVMRDVTERLRTERIRRDFVANVSHELKTPLASLTLLADTLDTVVKDEPQEAEQFIQRLVAETARFRRLVDDLLTLSQLEEGQSAPRDVRSTHNLVRLAHEVAEELSPLAEAKQQELAVIAAASILVMGEEADLRTLIRNLVDNAIRYTQDGGHIRVTVEKEEGDEGSGGAGRAVLSVQDNGPGISATDRERIFERFYRVDKARSRETGGTGLGLSIVKHIAERHGGSVWVESRPGEGSTFAVALPC
jgi:two-component system phosphate regulon sensor histidine kinase PhoR